MFLIESEQKLTATRLFLKPNSKQNPGYQARRFRCFRPRYQIFLPDSMGFTDKPIQKLQEPKQDPNWTRDVP